MTLGTSATTMNSPSMVVTDPTTGKIFVADTYNDRVLRFASVTSLINGNAAEAVLGQVDFTSSESALSATQMDVPGGLAIDSNGRLWVADTFNNRVLRFDNVTSKANGAAADAVLGQADFTHNVAATTQSGLNTPGNLIVDANGRLWVTDSSNSRVLRYDNAATKVNGANADGVLGQTDFTHSAPATT